MKNFIFLVGTTNWGVQDFHDKVLLHHLCIVCFITFLALYQGKFGFGKFEQKLGLRSDPPPLLGQMPNFFQKKIEGSPKLTQLVTRMTV